MIVNTVCPVCHNLVERVNSVVYQMKENDYAAILLRAKNVPYQGTYGGMTLVRACKQCMTELFPTKAAS